MTMVSEAVAAGLRHGAHLATTADMTRLRELAASTPTTSITGEAWTNVGRAMWTAIGRRERNEENPPTGT